MWREADAVCESLFINLGLEEIIKCWPAESMDPFELTLLHSVGFLGLARV